MSVTAVSAANVPRSRRRTLYVGLSVLMAAMAVIGFGPGYVESIAGNVSLPLLIHVHAVVFIGWLVLFAAQAVLAAKGKIRTHSTLGNIGIGYGVVLFAVGVYTTLVRTTALAEQGYVVLYVALLDMVIFAAFFGAAVWYRRRPELHRRLMTVAAASLVIAAVARVTYLPGPPLGPFVRFLIWSTPLAVAIAADLRQRKGVHPVYAVGLLAFALRIWTVPFARTDEWHAFAQWVYAFEL